ncbi:MAG: tRNA (adenosine(37)-N6)-threonylcarbamoyltransferase complex ATPase subunit type 1 TsaE [bacterium]|nr:tRNA (adenosine(37)-N6)-threonylcarbamoyltransferase complex ATPase subunit type 1 TsaE [bacterium]
MENIHIIIYSQSPLETEKIGETIGKISKGGELFLLQGNLGAGKTVLVKGIAKGLGIDVQIVSPSFIIMKNYYGRLILNHIDLYRVNSIEGLGIEEYIDDNSSVTVVEWGEKLISLLDLKEYLLIKIDITDNNSREITLIPKGERYIKFIERAKEWQI